MTITVTAYNSAKLNSLTGTDLETGPIYVMLLDESYTPDFDNHTVIGDVNGDEITGTGYVAGGKEIQNTIATQDNALNLGLLSGDPIIWATGTFTARYGVKYINSGLFPLVSLIDFGINKSVLADDFVLAWANGIIKQL